MKRKKKETLGSIKDKAWKAFSRWVRLSAADEGGTVECYTCGRLMHWKEGQAGHFVPGRTNSVLFNTDVVRVQCVDCNIFKRGNYHAFTLKMLDECGREKVDEFLALKHQTKKYTRSDLLELVEFYKGKINELEVSNVG